jgi:hypothetical protein
MNTFKTLTAAALMLAAGVAHAGTTVNAETNTPSWAKPAAPQAQTPQTFAEANVKFGQCVLPVAQYSQYSSYDGGKGAVAVLSKCMPEELALVEACERGGNTHEHCDQIALVGATIALKSFGK